MVFDDVKDTEELALSVFCKEAEELNFLVDSEDNLPNELKDLDLEEDKEKVC